MKKELIITAAAILIIATPAFAAKPADNTHGSSGEAHGSQVSSDAEESHGLTISQNQGGNGNSQTGNSNANPNHEINQPIVTGSVVPTVTFSLKHNDDEDESLTPTGTASAGVQCDPDANWKNHGAFVSCVAHLHGGGEEISEAARSDTGKKHIDETPTPSASPSPTISPITSAIPTVTSGISPLLGIGNFFGKIFGWLKHLI